MLWELYQMHQIGQAQSAANNSSSQALKSISIVEGMENRINKLILINMAMWALIQEISDLKEEDLIEKIKEIDLSDGKLDGRVRVDMKQCPKCNRVMSKKHARCLYCGYEGAGEWGAFQDVLA
ncbi:MAG: hypothetical protein GC154_04195 [bacterium]|nr:hypothetical protein [bacterium]